MTRDELEFSISQYLDGTLVESERGALETRLGTDAEARALFAEYESLQRVIVDAPVPAVNWENLSRHISEAVAREDIPATSYKIGKWFQPLRFAVAACVVLAIGAGVAITLSRNSGTTTPSPLATMPVTIVKVDPPDVDGGAVSAKAVQIAIGPPTGTTDGEPVTLRFADSVVQRPSKALIVSAAPVVQDGSQTPF